MMESRATREMTVDELMDSIFTFHPPTPDQIASYQRIRESAKALAVVLWNECPGGPDRTAALRKVREAVMTANASIATGNAASFVR